MNMNTVWAVMLLVCSQWAYSGDIPTQHNTDGQAVELEQQARRHLVFMDIFASYSGHGAELQWQQLPQEFTRQYPVLWVQPELNITREQVAEYQQLFPDMRPMVVDAQLQWMQHFNVWSSPYHVLLREGEVEFAGDYAALRQHLKLAPKVDPITADAMPTADTIEGFDYHYVQAGDTAPSAVVTTMTGEKIDLASWYQQNQGGRIVFLDSLCPMPHFPGCEQELQQLSQTLKHSSQGWLGVMNGFYVSQDIAEAFLQRFDLSLPVVFDQNNQLFGRFGVLSTPYVVEVDADGKLAQRQSLAASL
ncbi:hypothetical protein CHH28_08430 [Bacterioplanes sanyensis]|uniref:Alkyl hydroperoxide reductase subunit C/ Thiol specific antioxidant domain-containing protein n=1 Tax=Bacterioplanes sanyensis TaxID=1249553 RepID=A0A222FI25_9GAMM|nr:redoxin domain-containing protein [Bacterioplanes sanyensis]ASP38705.1 hypothetical protein CHH28_08430 [Bacterioplanes sanyensis]